MRTTTWISVALAVVVGGAGWLYVRTQTNVMVETPAASAPVAGSQPTVADDGLNRRRQDGIGSIRNLKPVPFGNGSSTKP